MGDNINVAKLDKEIRDAGIPIHGVNGDGQISYTEEATEEQKAQGSAIVSTHTPTWWIVERMKAYPSIGDQMDMLYWDSVNGTTTWKDAIAAVKTAIPKE